MVQKKKNANCPNYTLKKFKLKRKTKHRKSCVSSLKVFAKVVFQRYPIQF